MSSSINLSLTDELRAFVDANSGDGTLYATPSEFVRDLLRQQKVRQSCGGTMQSLKATKTPLLDEPYRSKMIFGVC